jgi:hypothetical protein
MADLVSLAISAGFNLISPCYLKASFILQGYTYCLYVTCLALVGKRLQTKALKRQILLEKRNASSH